MAVSMSRVFATAASVLAIAHGARVDEDAAPRELEASEATTKKPAAATSKKAWKAKGCTTSTTTTTTCVGADCVKQYWPWAKNATIGGVPVKSAAAAGLLQQDQKGINLMADLKQFGRDVEYEATHLGSDGAAAPAAQKHAASAAPAAAAVAPVKTVKKSGQPGESAEALIDEILDGVTSSSTTEAADGETTAADGETTEAAAGETTKAAEGEETTKAAEGETTKAAEGETTTKAETTKEALLQSEAAGTTTTPPPCLGDDLSSLRKRLDSLPCGAK